MFCMKAELAMKTHGLPAWRLRRCSIPLQVGTLGKPPPPPPLISSGIKPYHRHTISRVPDFSPISPSLFSSSAVRRSSSDQLGIEPEMEAMADVEWEEEEEDEPEIGDGRDGGGIALAGVSWGELALSVAREVLLNHFPGADIVLFGFKVSPKGYIYVRLDNLTNQYGCPGMDVIEKYNILYKKRLDELGETGELPSDLALEVSSPGAERLLRVPEDLDRFKEMPMLVQYTEEEDGGGNHQGRSKEGVFMLDSVAEPAGECVWKLANVKKNRGVLGKGRPLSRKQKDWRLKLPYAAIKKVMLYLDF